MSESTLAPVVPETVTPVPTRIPSLDGYRGVAALGVLVYHTSDYADFLDNSRAGSHLLDNLGNFCVAVFFLLSGIVIFLPFVSASLSGAAAPATAPFLIRRFLRIFPGYWIALIAWAATASPDARAIGTVWGKVLMTEPYDARIKYVLAGLGVSWTLTIEVAFYLLLPVYAALVALVARRAPDAGGRLRIHLIGLGALYLVPNLWRLFVDRWTNHPTHVFNWLPHFLDWFALGMLLGTLFAWRAAGGRLPRAVTQLADRPWTCWTLSLACYCIIVVLKGDRIHWEMKESTAQTGWRMFFQGLAAFFVLLPAVLGSRRQPAMRLFQARPVVFAGTISYGIYLWHTIVLNWMPDLFASTSGWVRLSLMSAVVAAVTIPIATASYYLVERPFSVMYRKRIAARSERSRTPADT